MKNYVLGSIVCSIGVIWHAFVTQEQCVMYNYSSCPQTVLNSNGVGLFGN